MAFYVLLKKTELKVTALSRIDPLPKTRSLVEEEQFAEAAEYLEFFMEYDYVRENPDAQVMLSDISDKREEWLYQADKLLEGLFTGNSDETLGKVAGVVSDFMVIGDVRDLTIQSINWSKGEETDKVVVALASMGVVATGAQIAGAGATVATGGVAAPTVVAATSAKSSLVLLKVARKLGKIPPWLAKTLTKAAKTVTATKSFATLTETFNGVRKLAGTRGGFYLLSVTTDAASLRRMVKFTNVFSKDAATLYRIGGNAVVDAAQRVDELGKSTIKLAATYGQDGVRLLNEKGVTKWTKLLARPAKIGYKNRNHIIPWLVDMIKNLFPPWSMYVFVLLGIVIWVPAAAFMSAFKSAFTSDQATNSDKPDHTQQTEQEQASVHKHS